MLDAAAIIGWYGLGIFFYVGGGSLVLGGSGFLHEHEIKSPDIDIWVTVRTCEVLMISLADRSILQYCRVSLHSTSLANGQVLKAGNM
jgi:hypothetical protein